MKKVLLLIATTLLFFSCSPIGKLNKRIDNSQQVSMLNSPFKSAKGMKTELYRQKKVRFLYDSVLDSLISQNPNDTIILIEIYDFICFDCPADYVQILDDRLLITFKAESDNGKFNYKRQNETLTKHYFDSQGYFQSDLFELMQEITTNEFWYKDPSKFGTDECLDGGQTFYSVLYPNKNIVSMYMRCWIPKEIRTKIKKNKNSNITL